MSECRVGDVIAYHDVVQGHLEICENMENKQAHRDKHSASIDRKWDSALSFFLKHTHGVDELILPPNDRTEKNSFASSEARQLKNICLILGERNRGCLCDVGSQLDWDESVRSNHQRIVLPSHIQLEMISSNVLTCKCKQANSPATVMMKTPTEKKYKSPLLEFSCKNELPGSTCPVLQHLYVRYEVSTLKATILFNVLRNRNNNVKCFLCCFSLQLLNFLKQCCHKALPPL